MKKKFFLITLISCFIFQPVETFATTNALSPTYGDQFHEDDVLPLKDIIKWRYKSKNGKIYKRQYNYSKEKWIGKWQLV